jgi:hypothetical protein
MKVFIEQTDQHAPTWDQIDWGQVERNVRRLQERIYRATERTPEVLPRCSRLERCAVKIARTVLCATKQVTVVLER